MAVTDRQQCGSAWQNQQQWWWCQHQHQRRPSAVLGIHHPMRSVHRINSSGGGASISISDAQAQWLVFIIRCAVCTEDKWCERNAQNAPVPLELVRVKQLPINVDEFEIPSNRRFALALWVSFRNKDTSLLPLEVHVEGRAPAERREHLRGDQQLR
jgi:hypothetical protein